ncbi:DeoR/GlpR family DNA-binding transcription regulator [Dyadobacter sp. 32]|uniref:DeoR/GlpR family DNA-binding transcription regulator n=1 Tax=Dyadobacter sp. 32 TaxID=538966 RepID=UPI0011ED27AD
MKYQIRKNIILDLLKEKGEVTVKQLAEELGTSEITVRRDLIQLTADGLVYRTHGGIMRVDLIRKPSDFAHKVAKNVAQKDHICRLAAQEITDGDIIFMDCGSTVFRLCQFIKNKKITVITNSLPVVYELAGGMVQVNLAGGEVDTARLAIHGSVAEEHVSRYHADKAFLGVDGISAKYGLTAHSEKEAGMTMVMTSHAKVSYLLCDSSKIGKDSYLRFAGLETVDVLITDVKNEEVVLIENSGTRIIC